MMLEKLQPISISAEVGFDSDEVVANYECNVTIPLAGDSLWDCPDRKVTITGISIRENEDDGYRHISVAHSGSWRVYTDSGFRSAVRQLLGDDSVDFTEQGMQDDNFASME